MKPVDSQSVAQNPGRGPKVHPVAQAELRSQIIAERKALSSEERSFKSSKISILLEELLTALAPKRVASFVAIQNEPELQLLSKSYTLCYPRVEGGELAFYETDAEISKFEKSPLNVPEPPLKNSRKVKLTSEDVILVPGVVFNFKGQRIGMGKGFYDRYLAQTPAARWGVGFSFQLLTDEWDAQDWDQKMDMVLTENFALDVEKVSTADISSNSRKEF